MKKFIIVLCLAICTVVYSHAQTYNEVEEKICTFSESGTYVKEVISETVCAIMNKRLIESIIIRQNDTYISITFVGVKSGQSNYWLIDTNDYDISLDKKNNLIVRHKK